MDTLSNQYIIENGIKFITNSNNPVYYTILFLLVFLFLTFYVSKNIFIKMKDRWQNQKIKLVEKNVRLQTHFSKLNPSPLFTIISIDNIEPINESAVKLIENDSSITDMIISAIRKQNFDLNNIIKNSSLHNFHEKIKDKFYSINIKGDNLFNFAQLYLNDITEIKSSQLKEIQNKKRLEELQNYYINQSEQEKKKLGQELHDAVGSNLALLKMLLQEITGNENQEAVAKAMEKLSLISTEVKEISYALNPSILQRFGLVDAVNNLVKSFNVMNKIIGTVIINGNPLRYDENTELNIYRVIQEGIANIFKHSESEGYEIMLNFSDEKLSVVITDNGKGFDDSKIFEDNKKHLGLLNINERIKNLSGIMNIESIINLGTKIFISIPVKGNKND